MGNSSSSPPPPPPPQPVATITSGANTSTPTIVLNSVGTFNIVATASSSVNYTGTTLTSLPVKVFGDTPDIEFSPLVVSNSPYTYVYEKNSYKYTEPVASITNNTGQILIYSIVTADSTTSSLTHSTVATIDPSGCLLTTVSCGTFMICATADVKSNGDFDSNVVLSDILTIVKATPTILQYPQINLNITPPVTSSTLVYGQTYTIIPDPSQISTITSNTDTSPPPNINYTSSDSTIATIYGTMVQIVGIGHFQIMTTVSPTTNYNQILRSPSPQIYETIQAVPTITSFPTIPQQLVYGGTPYVIPSTIITSNTDIPGPSIVTYTSSDKNVATISGNTITVAGVTGLINGIGRGNYQILVKIHSTINFYAMTYTYPSPTTYYQTIWATPNITFPNTFVTSSIYGSTYNFVAPILSNNDPSQTLTYSIVNSIPVVPSSTSVATIIYKSGVTNPSVVINSVGTFKIQASCLASDNSFYSPQTATSAPITIANEKPNIVFNTSYFNTIYTCNPTSTYPLTNPIASITNNKVQSLTYSIVATDGETPSTVATISSDGTSLTTNNVGSFQILATATATSNGDYGGDSLPSETIMIVHGTPSITTFPTLSLNFTYGNTYPIPYTTTPPYTIITTNIDIPGPTITYSLSNTAVATISGSVNYSSISNSAISSITGTSITIVDVGSFQINVTIGATTNYNQATYVYPSPTTYYNSVQATQTISPFSSNFGSAWIINGTYNLTSTVTTNAGPGYPIPNPVIYSIINPSVSNIATITTSGSGSGSGSQITINDVGTFQIQASLAATPNFTSAVSVQSNTITIVTSNVSLSSNNFSNFVYGGGPYTLSVTTNNTDTNPAPTITYQIFPQSGSTGNGTINGNVLTITAAGGAYIYVNVTATENFNSLNTCVYVNIGQATQVFSLNTNWLSEMYTTVTAGSGFGAGAGIASGTSNNTDPGGPTYSFQINGGAYVATVENGTINCIAPGSFTYSITASATANFSAVTLTTSTFYVCVLPEIILFNNSNSINVLEGLYWREYGMVIGFPRGGYPYGFSDYTYVTIQINNNSNYFMQFNISQILSSGLYSIFLDSNGIFPGTSGPLARAWNKGFAGNVGIVSVGSFNGLIANMLTGTISTVNFTFSGLIQYPTPTAPPSLSLNWSSGNLQLAQNQIYGSYYAIAPNQSPFNFTIPQGMTIQNGSYTVLWPGFGYYQGNLLYAWGVSVNTYQNDYLTNQPLLNGNNYYSPSPSANDNGSAPFGPNNNLYVGIPKILYNNY